MTKELLQRYFDNECSGPEKKAVDQWLLTASDAEMDLMMKDRWDEQKELMPDTERNALWERLQAEIRPVRKYPVVRRMPVKWQLVAAAAVLLVMSLVLFRYAGPHHSRIEIVNNASEPKKILLPDSSTVWLNGWSALAYEKDFNEQDRKLSITGEAYFVVKQDQRKPFIVYAGDIATTVLGTSFNVEAWSGGANTKVSLTSGKLAIGFKDGPSSPSLPATILSPGEMIIGTKNRKLTVQPVAVEKVQAWTEGHFVVNDMSLPEILQKMEKRFDIRFHFDGELLPGTACEHVAAIFAGESWQQIVKQLCFTCHLEFNVEGSNVFLKYASQ